MSGELPGSTHDTAAARIWQILTALEPHANAQLKYWHTLHKVRVSPRRIGRLAKAIHVLQNHEATTR